MSDRFFWSELDEHGEGFYISEDEATRLGSIVLKVTGPSIHRAVLQEAGFAVGTEVILQREPENPVDPRAIAVLNATGHHAGYVPRYMLDAATALMDAGPVHALVVWEWHSKESRTGIRLLVSHQQCEMVEEAEWGSRFLLIHP